MGNFLIRIALDGLLYPLVFAFREDEHILRRAILDEARYLQLAGQPLYLIPVAYRCTSPFAMIRVPSIVTSRGSALPRQMFLLVGRLDKTYGYHLRACLHHQLERGRGD
jgi:hypothetical protein